METFPFVLTVVLLISMSAICSGLNIALMAVSMSDLRRKARLGDRRAMRVLSVRRNSHLTLVSIIFTNIAIISATSLVMDERFNGVVAGIASTLLIVVFGEIFPQAYFARYSLSVVSFFMPLLKAMIYITYPVSKPLQLLMDKVIGHEPSILHSRRELGILLDEHSEGQTTELDENEVEIMRGALSLSNKQVRDIMTPISNVYWMTPKTKLTDKKIDELKSENYSRIPVFDKQLTTYFGVLLMKDLVDIDFDAQEFVVEDFYLHPTTQVGSKTALDTMFRKFIAARSHLIPVERDDKIIGIVTIEDLIEEILGHEIEDESDRRSYGLMH